MSYTIEKNVVPPQDVEIYGELRNALDSMAVNTWIKVGTGTKENAVKARRAVQTYQSQQQEYKFQTQIDVDGNLFVRKYIPA